MGQELHIQFPAMLAKTLCFSSAFQFATCDTCITLKFTIWLDGKSMNVCVPGIIASRVKRRWWYLGVVKKRSFPVVLAGISFSAPCANAGCMQNAVVSKASLLKLLTLYEWNAAMETLLETMLRKWCLLVVISRWWTDSAIWGTCWMLVEVLNLALSPEWEVDGRSSENYCLCSQLKQHHWKYASCVCSVMLYGSETLPVKVEDSQRLHRNEKSMIRWMSDVTLQDRFSIRARLGFKSILDVLCQRHSLVLLKGEMITIWRLLDKAVVVDPAEPGNRWLVKTCLLRAFIESLRRILPSGDLQLHEQSNPCLHVLIRLKKLMMTMSHNIHPQLNLSYLNFSCEKKY